MTISRQVAPRGVQKDLAFELEGGMRCGDHAMALQPLKPDSLSSRIHKIHKIHKPCPDPRIDPCWDPENMLIPVFGLLWHDGYPKQCGEVFNPSTAGSIKSVKGHVQTKYAVPSHSMLSFDDLFVWLDFPVMWWLT
jgi:hypothetical protein